MKTDSECPACIERLARQTVDMATTDIELRREALAEALDVMRRMLSPEKVPTEVAAEIQRVIKRVTGNRDPHREWKDNEMKEAERLFKAVRPRYANDMRSLLTVRAWAIRLISSSKDGRHEMLR